MFYQITLLSISLVAAFLQVEAVALFLNRENERKRSLGKSPVELAGWPDKKFDGGNLSHGLKTPVAANSTGVPKASLTSVASVAGQSQSESRIFFLFLTSTGIQREELWRAFFENQTTTRWRVFMHCTNSDQCKEYTSQKSKPSIAKQVDTVPSEYCQDLVSPMVQLLTSALAESASSSDKFVFASDTTLPIKPFSEVYSALMHDQNSDFCLFGQHEWPQFLGKYSEMFLVKHSQWMVLNQVHAKALVQRWPRVKAGIQTDPLSVPRYHENIQGPSDAIPVPKKLLVQCKDEWAIFATIYGAFVNKSYTHSGHLRENMETLPGLSGPPVRLDWYAPTTQGICRTFAFWDRAQFGESDLMKAIRMEWKDQHGTILSCYPKCPATHPAVFEALSDIGALALRRSRYLFARKFTKYTPTEDQFRRFFLAEGNV